jgi:hypothetical protein
MRRYKQIAIFILGLIFLSPILEGQDIKIFERNLSDAFGKIDYWSNRQYETDYNSSFTDSLENANNTFEKLLLDYTANYSQTLKYEFKNLIEEGVLIVTSEDGLFRIYSWDTQVGGTMHIYNNLFQFSSKNKVFSKISPVSKGEDSEAGSYYFQINDIISNNKKYYITQSRAILDSRYYYNILKIFSIDNLKLNDNAKLIKTKNGLRNKLSYEIDLNASSNRDVDVPDFSIIYDKENKTISIPVILEDFKITDKRIIYLFKGKYFERM